MHAVAVSPSAVLGIPAFAPGQAVALDFLSNRYRVGVNGAQTGSFTALSGATFTNSTGGYAQTKAGALQLFPPNIPRITDQGILIEGASTNLFLNSFAPATQTITLGATGSFTLGLWGTGSATIAAGTATITGAGTATGSSSVTISCTVAGTVTVTISGSPTAVQLEAGTFRSSPIPTTSAAATRGADVASIGGLSVSQPLTLAAQGLPGSGLAPRLATVLDGISADFDLVYNPATSKGQVFGPGLTTTDVGPVLSGQQLMLAANLTAGVVRASSLGSVAAAIVGTATIGNVTTLRVGDVSGGNRPANGYVQQIRIYPFAATDAQLQSISAGNF